MRLGTASLLVALVLGAAGKLFGLRWLLITAVVLLLFGQMGGSLERFRDL